MTADQITDIITQHLVEAQARANPTGSQSVNVEAVRRVVETGEIQGLAQKLAEQWHIELVEQQRADLKANLVAQQSSEEYLRALLALSAVTTRLAAPKLPSPTA